MPLGRFHNLGQYAAHIFWVNKEDHRAVRADAGLPQHALAHRFKFGLCGGNVRHFIADMMLPALRIFFQKISKFKKSMEGLEFVMYR